MHLSVEQSKVQIQYNTEHVKILTEIAGLQDASDCEEPLVNADRQNVYQDLLSGLRESKAAPEDRGQGMPPLAPNAVYSNSVSDQSRGQQEDSKSAMGLGSPEVAGACEEVKVSASVLRKSSPVFCRYSTSL